MLTLATLAFLLQAPDPLTITIGRDNIAITQSCRVVVAAAPIIDADGNGVIHIAADNVAVEFAAVSEPLCGANPEQQPDSFTGVGIVITGKNVTLSGAKVSGYKVGIHAIKADGLTIRNSDVSGNFAQRLKSTPQAEDASDWLWPHANDTNEWITNYGAGLCVENSSNVTLHDIRARTTQNGIILDAVNDSKVYDCDCSFLSGWGLAMWRSSRNVIGRNAFDFCVRGYSHGVYNRGQDSAGILMFEQCCDNIIAENSCTHGGDGFFGFAGKEALGEVNPQPNVASYKHRGCDDNVFAGNDFSYAAAHGLELTFSFKNRISDNVFHGNAICGIWGGYSQATIIDHNHFTDNGEGAYGLERGGVNIEHGRYNMIALNAFERDACGVHLWWDDDKGLLEVPWSRVNEPFSSNNTIAQNRFAHIPVAIQLRGSTLSNIAGNVFEQCQQSIEADDTSANNINDKEAFDLAGLARPSAEIPGVAQPVGARARFAGRDTIIMTEWGPWDHESPLLQFQRADGCGHAYRVLGMPADAGLVKALTTTGKVFYEIGSERITIRSSDMMSLVPYEIRLNRGSVPALIIRGVLECVPWRVTAFASAVDPREDVGAWRKGATSGTTLVVESLNLLAPTA
jgi:parallel beta-helix repeat protein